MTREITEQFKNVYYKSYTAIQTLNYSKISLEIILSALKQEHILLLNSNERK